MGGEFDPDSRTVDIHVQRLKRKMGLEHSIVSVRNVGYRLEVSGDVKLWQRFCLWPLSFFLVIFLGTGVLLIEQNTRQVFELNLNQLSEEQKVSRRV